MRLRGEKAELLFQAIIFQAMNFLYHATNYDTGVSEFLWLEGEQPMGRGREW